MDGVKGCKHSQQVNVVFLRDIMLNIYFLLLQWDAACKTLNSSLKFRSNILSGIIWVQSVCIEYQQTTKVAIGGEGANISMSIPVLKIQMMHRNYSLVLHWYPTCILVKKQ